MRYLVWLFLGASIVPSAGCQQPDIGTVSGRVTINGEPAENGSIAFFPVSGASFTTGSEISQGRYRAKVPPGKSRVEIRVSRIVGEQKLYDTPHSPTQPIMEELLPARYNVASELAIDVVVGINQYDFDLTTE